MNREIKFRAWNKRLEKMVEYFNHHEEFKDWMDKKSPFNSSAQNNYKLMQYTGLTDKNGKEIYEGDIAKTFNKLWNEEKGHYEVEVKNPFVVEFGEVYADHILVQGFSIGIFNCEVIGNIYENPELLPNQ